jgi:hypothetical protein
MRVLRAFACLACVFLLVPTTRAQITGKDRQEAKKMASGTLYLRIDAPCKSGRRFGYGFKLEPLLEVSPTEHKLLAIPDDSDKESKNIFWFGPNDALGQAALSYSGDIVTIWMEGLPPKDNEAMIKFVQIKTLGDFKAAFERTFSKVPLQDEHPEWPTEIRKAIAEQRVVEGMTKEQAFCVVGTPSKVTTSQENGVEIESWTPRQNSGNAITWSRKRKGPATEFPALMKFEGGKLTVIEKRSEPPEQGKAK